MGASVALEVTLISRPERRARQLGMAAAIVAALSVIAQVDVIRRYYPPLRAAAEEPGAVAGQPYSVSAYGYGAVDSYLRAVEKAGANLTTETFIKAMDTMKIPPDIFGSAEMTFSPTKRLGSNATRLSQLQENRWKVVSDYMQISQ